MFKKIVVFVLMFGLVGFNFSFLGLGSYKAEAASLSAVSDTVGDLTTAVKTSQIIKFTTPTGLPASSTVVLTFDNGTDTTGLIFSDVTVTAPSAVTVVAGAPGATVNWGFVNTSSTVLTFTLGSTATVAPGAIVTLTFNGMHKITNGTAGTTTLSIAAGADTGIVSMAIVANGVVSVSANVLTSISFAISANAIYFGNLSASTNCFARNTGATGACTTTALGPFTLAAGTNASTGYSISVQGDTLKHGTDSITPLASATTPSAGTLQFGLNLVASGGSGAVSSPYSTAGQYAYTATASTPATVATAAGPSATTTYTANYVANIAALTPAGAYTTAHTYVATGNF